MAEHERDPSPVGDWDASEQGEISNEPDAARADDLAHAHEVTDDEPDG